MAVVPLLGLVATTLTSINTTNDLQARSTETLRTADRAAGLTRLDGALFDEMIWTAVNDIADTLQMPAPLLISTFGSNPQDDLSSARTMTDEYTAELAFGDLHDDVLAARSTEWELRELLSTYGEMRDRVRAELDAELTQLAGTPGSTSASVELQESVELLQAGITLRGAIADAYYEYFAIRFDIRDAPVAELARLIETRSTLQDSLALISDITSNDLAAGNEVEAILEDPALVAFLPAIDEIIDESLTGGLPERGAQLSLGSVIADVDGITAAYTAAGQSTRMTLALLDRASDQVVLATQRLADEVKEDVRRSYAFAGLLVVATIAAVLLAAGFFVRPLRNLQNAVDQLHTGSLDEADVSSQGPIEVKAAAAVLRETAQQLSLVTSQARALAIGDLEADVLQQDVTGGLGEAVQSAVARLRTALTRQEQFRRRLAHEASHDGLTQIPNRNASMAQLTRSLARTHRSSANLAVLFIDLDNFKNVNDHLGHQAGDAVLSKVAQRLVGGVRDGDFVGRLGGDEFIVIAEPVHDQSDALDLATRLIGSLSEPIEVADGLATVQASIGLALADDRELTADELLRDADLAVYRAKDVGGGDVYVCDDELRRQNAASADMTKAIERAIDQDEFVMHYQPIISAEDGTVRAMESLVRWRRGDTQELVPPGAFIGFAERSTLIIEIDRWVIDRVVQQIALWQGDARYAGVPIAINISGRHLLHQDIVSHILEPLDRYEVDPQLVIVELTESALLHDLATAATKLGRLREVGVRVAIDDFGTGYTSLAHLRSLPVDILKIDRSFTSAAAIDPSEASIVKLIIDAGHLLGATITAEGIETAEEADQLRTLGSDTLQGFFFAQPEPAAEPLVGRAG